MCFPFSFSGSSLLSVCVEAKGKQCKEVKTKNGPLWIDNH